MLKINSIYESIQGEGIDQGKPTTFIRFSGCNLKCSWCDTSYHNEGKMMSVSEIVSEVGKYKNRHIYITGGEPLMQIYNPDFKKLIKELIFIYDIRLATNGTIELPNYLENYVYFDIDCKCPSSGISYDDFNLDMLDISGNSSLKFVVKDDKDLEFVDSVLKDDRIKESSAVKIISPCLPNSPEFLQKVWKFAIEHQIRFSYQIHKLIFPTSVRDI